MPIITTHANQRLVMRVSNVKEDDIDAYIWNVWNFGKHLEDVSNSYLRKYAKKVMEKHGNDRTIRVKANIVYVFSKSGCLLTVIPVPQEIYQGRAHKHMKHVDRRKTNQSFDMFDDEQTDELTDYQ